MISDYIEETISGFRNSAVLGIIDLFKNFYAYGILGYICQQTFNPEVELVQDVKGKGWV